MPSLAKQVHDAMRGEESPFASIRSAEDPALLPPGLKEAVERTPGNERTADGGDAAAFCCALGAGYVLARLEEPFAPHDHLWARAEEAATKACIAYSSVGGEVVE